MNNLECRRLQWDSEFFGFPIGKLEGKNPGRLQIGAFLRWRAASDFRCIYYLVPCDDVASINMTRTLRFQYVDLRVTLTKSHWPTASPHSSLNTIVRTYRAGDLSALTKIAAVAHLDSRFYTDTRFPRERTSKLYQVWIEKACADRTGSVFVADLDGDVAGYLVCKQLNASEGQIDLFAVRNDARGKGLGSSLLSEAGRWFDSHGIAAVKVVTQGRNLPGLSLYQRHGFHVKSIDIWFHWWSGQRNGK